MSKARKHETHDIYEHSQVVPNDKPHPPTFAVLYCECPIIPLSLFVILAMGYWILPIWLQFEKYSISYNKPYPQLFQFCIRILINKSMLAKISSSVYTLVESSWYDWIIGGVQLYKTWKWDILIEEWYMLFMQILPKLNKTPKWWV